MSRVRLWALLVLVGLVSGGMMSSQAVGATITFDGLTTGGPGGAGALVTVNSQFAAQGVTFNNVSAIDYSKGPFAIPSFAHSGTVAVEQCFAQEFCTSPVRADFTTGQLSVKVFVGASFTVSQAIPIRLTAFDAANAVVGTADGTLPVSSGPVPVQIPLEVTTGAATIRRLEVNSPGGFMNGIVVDDVEFTAEGPPPVCPATEVPTVTLTQPIDNTVVQRNEFLLQGTVATGGAPIESARIIAEGSTARSGNLFPTVIRPEGGTFGPIRLNGLLLVGNQKVRVEATNCRGTGTSANPIVTHAPLPAGTSFRLLRLEVTQGVQSSENTVPLLAAGANGTKRTFARVYLTVEGGAASVSQVSATLTATREDGTQAPGPPGVAPLRAVTVNAGGDLPGIRRSLDTSLLFELPRAWLAEGRVHFQVTRLTIEGAETTFPCQGCDNRFGTQPILRRFNRTPPVRIQLVGVPYVTPPSNIVHQPAQTHFDHIASWLRRAYPADEVQITQAALATLPRPPASCDDVNIALSNFAAGLNPQADPRTVFYGVVDDNSGNNFLRGCAVIGGRFANGPAGTASFGWDNDGSYADWYGGHEIGHTYGRLHPGFCGESDDDDGYPYAGGVIGTPVFDVQGFDAGDTALGLPFDVLDRSETWRDVMTYCDFQWLSDYTYRGILARVCADDRPNCPNHAVLAGTGSARLAPTPVPRRTAALGLSITGTLTPSTGNLDLSPLSLERRVLLSVRPASSRYAIQLLGADGAVLARYPFTPRVRSIEDNSRRAKALVDEVVPFRAGTARIVITDRARSLASVRVSARAPRVRILAPNRGGRLGNRVTVRWRASDPDGGRLWATVLYSPNGTRFIPVATYIRGSRLTVDLSTLPGGSRGRFRVIVTDGVRTGADTTDRRLTVSPKPPQVAIAAPAEGADLLPDMPVNLVASVTDLQDTRLPASRVTWSSSLQGDLGTGTTVTATLQPGAHVITVAARNRAGLTSRAQVNVTVRQPPPPVVAAVP